MTIPVNEQVRREHEQRRAVETAAVKADIRARLERIVKREQAQGRMRGVTAESLLNIREDDNPS